MEAKEAVKILRTELDMTQPELAAALGVAFKSISRWELGQALPRQKTAEAIIALAGQRGASKRCVANLRQALRPGKRPRPRVPKSKLYPVDRESICALVDESHNAIYVSSLETDELLYANKKAEEYAGARFKVGEKCYQFLYGRSTPCRHCPKADMLENESTNYHMVSPKDGRSFLFRGRKLIWNGRPAHAQYFFEEATALEGQDGYHALIDHLDVGVCSYWVRDDGRIEMNYMSDGYFGVVGSTREKRMRYVGYSVTDAICPEDKPAVLKKVRAAGQAQQSFRVQYKVMTDDGGLRALYMRANFIRREKEKSLFYCIVMDVDA